VLRILGAAVGQALGRYYLEDALDNDNAHRSIMMILGTDAPFSDRNLSRLARRALFSAWQGPGPHFPIAPATTRKRSTKQTNRSKRYVHPSWETASPRSFRLKL
jgi:hypothetical protein